MLNPKIKMKHFITLKDIPAADLRRIVTDAKKRKDRRKKFSTLEIDKDEPFKRKIAYSNV